MVSIVISEQARTLLEANALYGKLTTTQPVPSMPGYVWIEVDEEVLARLNALIDWSSVDDDAKAEATAYSDIIIRLCTQQLGRA